MSKLESTDCVLAAVMDTRRVLEGSSGIGLEGCEFAVCGKGDECAMVAVPDILAGGVLCRCDAASAFYVSTDRKSVV